MKAISLIITIILSASLICAAPAAKEEAEDGLQQNLERTVAAAPNVVVTVCLASGNVIVHGWERSDVRARTSDAVQLELQGGAAAAANKGPATRIEVVISNEPAGHDGNEELTSDCSASSDIELDVPRGATVQIKTQDGDVEVANVSDARVETLSGDVSVRRVAKRVEASSVSGDVSLEDSSGPVRLRSISGSVEGLNARTLDATDDYEATTVSGDVTLDRISHTRVEASTVSGTVSLRGPLARGGRYEFKTTSGDVMFMLPADASFRINARVPHGEVVTDFSLRTDAAGTASPSHNTSLLTGTYGTGDATLDLYSFSGTVRLRRNVK